MRLLIVGTGRCGTLSWAKAFGGVHEGHKRITVPLAAHVAAGSVTSKAAADWLRQVDWADVEAGFMFTPLVAALDVFQPKWLWTVRQAVPTVASMVRRAWYRPEDDDLLPFLTMYLDPQEGKWQAHVPPQAFRITAPLVGETSLREWKRWPQHVRCAWWWDWTVRRLAATLPPGRTRIALLEKGDPTRTVSEWVGIPCLPLPRLNMSAGPALTGGERRDVEAITGRSESQLY